MVEGRTRLEVHALLHRCCLLCILLAMLLAPSVGARPAANPAGRLVLGPGGPRGAAAQAALQAGTHGDTPVLDNGTAATQDGSHDGSSSASVA